MTSFVELNFKISNNKKQIIIKKSRSYIIKITILYFGFFQNDYIKTIAFLVSI